MKFKSISELDFSYLKIIGLLFFLFPFLAFTQDQHLLSLEKSVDSLVNNAISEETFPGAQVLIIHKNKTLLHKAYGFHTYDKQTSVDTTHLYDLASVTKVMAGGLALMKLQDEQKFHPDMTLSQTHPYFKNSDKASIKWRPILAHQANFEPYIVFWQRMKRKNGKYKWRTFKNKSNVRYNIQINDEIFLHRRYPKLMYKAIKKSPLKSESKYLYSGLCYLLIPDMVRDMSGLNLDQYLEQKYFKPLNLERISFNPAQKFAAEEIIPTEMDTFFRFKLVQGYVHDENASMLSGVSGNAGLFSNASDLGKIAQMLLNKGRYQDKQLISEAILNEYTSIQFEENDNRRGLTFDKPPLSKSENSWYISQSASPSSFGHSGFTGTFIWMDPEHELIIIFLSNRVYPYRSQRKLYSSNFRPKLHQLAYDYVEKAL